MSNSDLREVGTSGESTPPIGDTNEGFDAIHRDLADAARRSFHVEGVRVTDGMTLLLHGEVDLESVPHLQAVLDGLALLQPLHLIIDLSEVGRVSLDALRLIDGYNDAVGGLVLRSPSSATSDDLALLGRSELIE